MSYESEEFKDEIARSESNQFYDVTVMFRVPRDFVESKTPQEWRATFIDDGHLDVTFFTENYEDPEKEFDYGEVAKILAWNYMGGGDYVTGYETMETDVEKTWED